MNLNSAEPNEIIRLREGKGVDGVLQNIAPGEDGYILANISGLLVEFPKELMAKFEPLMGQETRTAFLCGKYHVCKMIRRPQT